MIKIHSNGNNFFEKEYIFNILFNEYLGLNYTYVTSEVSDYLIELSNGNKLIIRDSFFSKFKSTEYLSIKNLPESIKLLYRKDFLAEENIVIIYGNDEFEVSANQIICGLDVFASAFFMLTRWEEYVSQSKDLHGRFSVSSSVAFKHNFLDRPIVNEYIEMFYNMLHYLDKSIYRKKLNFTFIPTHDIDHLLYWDSHSVIKDSIKNLIIDKDILRLMETIKSFSLSHISCTNDPYYKYDYFMDLAELRGVKAHFLFMSGGSAIYDNNYKISDLKVNNIINKIIDREHVVGIHPSYNSFDNKLQIDKEIQELKNIVKTNIYFSRQHYLRFSIPGTWQNLDDLNIKWDSTIGYYEIGGYRCGICKEFPVFNIITRKKLDLYEKPLIFMDVSYINYQNSEPQIMYEKVKKLYLKTKKYNGDFVFLWHNSTFYKKNEKKYGFIYDKLMNDFI